MGQELDARPEARVAAAAARQWGVLSLAELRACGLSAKAVSAGVRAGRLHRLHRAVYAVGHPAVPLEGCFLAAVKACGPGAVLSHYSAAALFGFVEWDGRAPEVVVAGGSACRHPGLRVHRSATLSRRDLRRERGIPVTSPARTLADLAAVLAPAPWRRALREAQGRGRVRTGQLAEVVERLGPRRGSAEPARILAAGPAPTRSEFEDVVLALIERGGLERPRVNVPLRLDRRTVIPDFRWPAQRLIVEADGAAWHEQRPAREADAERQALLEAHGERVLRVTWRQADAEPRRTLARLRAAGAPAAGGGDAGGSGGGL